MAKHGMPDTKWFQCPKLSPVVEATLSKDVANQIYRCQGFQGGYPLKFNRASGGSRLPSYGPGNSKKGTSFQGRQSSKMTCYCKLFFSTSVQISMNVTNPTPRLTQICSQADHFKVLISQMDFTIKSPCLAGRLSHYTHNWEHITLDRWVLQAINGYSLELTQTPYQMRQPQPINCSIQEHAKITQEVSDLLIKGAIVEPRYPQAVMSPNYSWWRRKGEDKGK